MELSATQKGGLLAGPFPQGQKFTGMAALSGHSELIIF